MTLACAGLLAGFVHVLSGPDHLGAMAPYAVSEKSGASIVGTRCGATACGLRCRWAGVGGSRSGRRSRTQHISRD
jgi:hypothetical protein